MRKSGLPSGAWVVVADGEKALVLVNDGDDIDMNLRVVRKDEQDNPKAGDWAANRPGRFNNGPSVHRSAVQDTDWHVLEKERFANQLADRLYKWAHAGRFQHLVILASRPILGPLRQEMHQEVSDRVILELPKVVTNHPLNEVETILTRELNAAE